MTFVVGHTPWNKDKIWNEMRGENNPSKRLSVRKRISEAKKGVPHLNQRGKNHPLWKNGDVGYRALHDWVVRHLGKADVCKSCRENQNRVHWANKSGKYKRDLKDWIKLCVPCHKAYDKGREDNK